MSEKNIVNIESLSKQTSKEIDIPNEINQTNTQEILNIFCKDITKINIKDECGWTPLYRTVIAGDILSTKILLTKGANPNIQCSMGETPLFQAVEMGKLEHIKLLLNNGANPNIANEDGISPLHSAVINQNLLIVKNLLKKGANPNIKSKMYSQTPVHLAIKNNVDPMIMLILVQFNGSLLELDKFGKKPIDYISSKEMSDAIEKLKFEQNPNRKLVVLAQYQTPKKMNSWTISKVCSNTIRSKSPKMDIQFNSNTVLKEPGMLKCNIIGNNGTEKPNIEKKDKENCPPNTTKIRKLSYSIKDDSPTCIESDKENLTNNVPIIKRVHVMKNKNKKYQGYDNYSFKNIVYSSKNKKIKKNINETTKNFSKIPKNKSNIKGSKRVCHVIYDNGNMNENQNNNNIQLSNFQFIEICGSSKNKNSSSSTNNENIQKTQKNQKNQSLNMSEYLEPISEKSVKSSNYLYSKPKINNIEITSKKIKTKEFINKVNNKYSSDIKHVFTFMEKEKKYKNKTTNNNQYCNNDSINLDFPKNSHTLSHSTRNISTLYEEQSLTHNNLWKFKSIEADKKLFSSSLTTISINVDPTNKNNNEQYPIFDWLREINLTCYYDLFIEKKIFYLDKVIYNLKNGLCNITKNDIIKLGIVIPGHIYRIIVKLEIDAEKIDNQIFLFLFGKKNLKGEEELNILKNSIYYFCGCCSINNQSKYLYNDNNKKFQFDYWLNKIRMIKYKKNFEENGFDIFDYFILQMFSSIPIDENILRDDLKIESLNDRDIILLQINKDIKFIIQKLKRIKNYRINNEIILPEKKPIYKKDDENFLENQKEEMDESSGCNIF